MAARPIFEEVTEGQRSAGGAPQAVGAIGRGGGNRAGLRLWLLTLGMLLVAMILVGGLTRLTDSGLAITEWKPLVGALPPLTHEHWLDEFALYRETAQFQQLFNDMTLSEFQFIYWWEWGHRQLGRLIGLVWAAGYLWFWARGQVPAGWHGRLLLLGALGGLQGLAGWWMVSSGIGTSLVYVASYRLALHLGLAFLILGLIWLFALQLARPQVQLLKARRAGEPALARAAWGLVWLAGLQILLGALVAGIDAGRGYTDWPWMAGGLFPPDMWRISPLWRNFFENDGTVQLVHRLVGYLVFLGALALWWRARRSPHPDTGRAAGLGLALVLAQIALGVVTVMHSSPLHYAILHQAGAILVLLALIRAAFLARHPHERSLRA